jgi:hypothetical protein
MSTQKIVLEIGRNNNELTSVKVIMPTWSRIGDDGNIHIKMPLLGDIETFASNEEEAGTAVREAFQCFCLAAERFGKGLEKELENLGWERHIQQSKRKHFVSLNINSKNQAFNSMVNTGELIALSVQPNMAFA